ncbi:MAG: sodium:alanine symporter family protein [Oscillospiraceae bacterium]|nr:sodium:alanine symporter family protein [Oscillospiraceae bacterium]
MFFSTLEDTLWAGLFLPLFLLSGVSLIRAAGPLPFRALPSLLRTEHSRRQKRAGDYRGIQAASVSLSATIGTGNIVGTAQAIAMGGPGAVFWMWIAAVLGMWIKYAEILLGQLHPGGAVRYIRLALGKKAAGAYALLGALSALAVGDMAQMNGAVSAVSAALPRSESPTLRILLALVLSTLLWSVLAGGAARVGHAAEALVPGMTIVFLFFTARTILAHHEQILPIFREICRCAFHPEAIRGAVGGIGVRQTILWGLRRGAFSNEAGLGTASIVHSAVASKEPAIHASWGIVEVFVDTILLCTFAALTILCSGADIGYGHLPGPELFRDALASVWGTRTASWALSLFLALFSFTTVMGCSVTGTRCFCALFDPSAEQFYRTAYVICAVLGCLLPTEAIWRAADLINVSMAVPALLSLVLLSPSLGREILSRLRMREDRQGS